MEGRTSKRVLIIGAHGVLGGLTASAFGAAGWDVRRAARRPAAGEVDLDLDRAESIAAAIREDEVIVNTVPHPALLPERLVLERGGVLINTSALSAAAGRALRAVAGGARGTVVMNAGLAPGVTTIVAADLLHLHPGADDLEIVFTISAETPRGPASADFIRRRLTKVARHRTALVPLPDPFGERLCIGFGEGEAEWLGGIAEGRVVRLYVCINEPALHDRLVRLNAAGRMAELPKSVIATRRPPADRSASDEPVAHWVAARRAGRRLAARTVECQGDFLHAARSTVVQAEALIGRRGQGGCFDPEELFTLSGVKSALQAAGVAIVEG